MMNQASRHFETGPSEPTRYLTKAELMRPDVLPQPRSYWFKKTTIANAINNALTQEYTNDPQIDRAACSVLQHSQFCFANHRPLYTLAPASGPEKNAAEPRTPTSQQSPIWIAGGNDLFRQQLCIQHRQLALTSVSHDMHQYPALTKFSLLKDVPITLQCSTGKATTDVIVPLQPVREAMRTHSRRMNIALETLDRMEALEKSFVAGLEENRSFYLELQLTPIAISFEGVKDIVLAFINKERQEAMRDYQQHQQCLSDILKGLNNEV